MSVEMKKVGGTQGYPHMDGNLICAYFGLWCRVEGAKLLEKIGREGMSADVHERNNLERELDTETCRSAVNNGGGVLNKAATDVALGRAMLFPVT